MAGHFPDFGAVLFSLNGFKTFTSGLSFDSWRPVINAVFIVITIAFKLSPTRRFVEKRYLVFFVVLLSRYLISRSSAPAHLYQSSNLLKSS